MAHKVADGADGADGAEGADVAYDENDNPDCVAIVAEDGG